MAPASKRSHKRKHLTEAPSSSDDDFETSEILPRKVKKQSSSCKSTRKTSRKSSCDENLTNGTSTDAKPSGTDTLSGASSQGASSSTSSRPASRHSKRTKGKGKSTKLSAGEENGTDMKLVVADGKRSSADITPSTSHKKRTEAKNNVVNGKHHGKQNGTEHNKQNGKMHEEKLVPDLSDDDSDFAEENPCSPLEEVKKGLLAFRYQKNPKTPKMLVGTRAAEPIPSTSTGTSTCMPRKKTASLKVSVKETLKVKVKKSSASPKVSSGKKKPGQKSKAKGQDVQEDDGFNEQKRQRYANLEARTQEYANLDDSNEFFEVTRRKSNNIVLSLNRMAMGLNNNGKVYASPHESYLRTLRSLGLYRTASPFDRRVTALEWHPSHPTLVAAGSKGGDIILWNFEKVGADCFIQGRGPGGSVSAMKFSPWNDSQVYTAQLDGTVNLLDFNGRNNRNFLSTDTWSYWYCAVDVNAPHRMLVAGDSLGHVVMMDTEGDKLWQHRLHKSKVTHVEFNPGCDWLMVTASTDKTVKLWDIRMVEGRGSALYTLEHDFPINSAYFSSNDHCKLLTTDQHHDIRVYNGPDWGRLDTVIYHPHRFFQHLTPIKASWHPLYDLAVVGRYPDNKSPHHQPGETNTIDILNINTGETVCQLWDRGAPGIKSLNRFSPGGESLASAMGYNILIWQRKEVLQEKQEKLMEKMRGEVSAHLDTPGVARRPRPRPPSGKMAAKIKKKLQDM